MNGGGLSVRIVGPVSVVRDGQDVALPPSRKVLTLLAYLALESNPSRSRLCDLFWDSANDPRGELRWCLSKLRGIVDDERVVTKGKDLVGLDLTDAFVDAITIEHALTRGLPALSVDELMALRDCFRGEFLEGVDADGAPELAMWLTARRQRYRAARIDCVRELAGRSDFVDALARLEEWVSLAPFDRQAHEALLGALATKGRARDGEEHLARAARAFEQEGLDWAPLREAWRSMRGRASAAIAVRSPPPAEVVAASPSHRRASVAVMPFSDGSPARPLGHGITDDIITRLAKLRALFVIARGSTYALGERGLDAVEAGVLLGVDYVVSGRVRADEQRITVLVELAEARTAQIVWTDEIPADTNGPLDVLDTIVDRIVAAIAEEIEAAECRRAVLKPPASLDAWEAYHRGLWHMYKFTHADNREAERFFRRSIELDQTFARAHSGLSFTHFQNVFLELTPDREQQVDLTFTTAAASLAADERDPAAHWAMGRALWLRGETTESISVLQRSIELSPNFALGHYMVGFVQAQSGDPSIAIAASDFSRSLSPFDPLQFGMLGSRALAHMRRGEHEEALVWALRAAARPNAHAHILAIAASMLGLVDRRDEARALVGRIRAHLPTYDVDHFLRAFRFDRDSELLLRRTARRFDF